MRLSLSDCITSKFPDTYTALGMTLDFFLKKAAPGTEIVIDHVELWPSQYIHKYKIPSEVSTVLYSPFNEVVRRNILINSTRYTLQEGLHNDKIRKKGKLVSSLDVNCYAAILERFNRKIEKMWPGLKKILIFYNTNRAGSRTKLRIGIYNQVAAETLKWPTLEISDKHSNGCSSWFHYGDKDKEKLYNKLLKLKS